MNPMIGHFPLLRTLEHPHLAHLHLGDGSTAPGWLESDMCSKSFHIPLPSFHLLQALAAPHHPDHAGEGHTLTAHVSRYQENRVYADATQQKHGTSWCSYFSYSRLIRQLSPAQAQPQAMTLIQGIWVKHSGRCQARGQTKWSRRPPWTFRLPIKSFPVLDLATVTSSASSTSSYIYWQLD